MTTNLIWANLYFSQKTVWAKKLLDTNLNDLNTMHMKN